MLNRKLSGALLMAATFAFLLALHATGCSSSGGTSGDAGGDVASNDATFAEGGHDGSTDATSDATMCPSGQTSCNGTCTNTASDPKNCGVCGATCGSGLVCAMSTCALSCGDASGLTQCGSGCYDLTTDSDNCGACNHMCPTGQVCNNSTCGLSCPAGESLCTAGDGGAGACVDLNSDNANCGGCGRTCAAGTVCAAGQCGLTCTTGYTACGTDAGTGYCADTQIDNNNCGACGHQCSAGQVCNVGTCATSCGGNLVDCGGKCVDPTSNAYCGATAGCGVNDAGSPGQVCPAGTQCTNGTCPIVCPGAEVNCGGLCVDPSSSNAHCGVQAGCVGGVSCSTGDVCSNGTCQSGCGGNLILCGGICIDPQTNTTNCGATGNCQGVNAGTQCQPGDVCTLGQCQLHCLGGLVACPTSSQGDSCIDPNTNNLFCGASMDCTGVNAGMTCPSGYVCANGTCSLTCQSGLINCNNTCVNPLTDPHYCGAQAGCTGFTDCTLTPGYVCTGGNPDGGAPPSSCQLSCQGSLVDCLVGGTTPTCIDPSTSNAFCGAMGNCTGANAGVPCVGATTCGANPGTPPPLYTCNSTCIAGSQIGCPAASPTFCADFKTDNSNCGGCGVTCKGTNTCGYISGNVNDPSSYGCVSTCTAGQIPCPPPPNDTFCANYMTDNNNCGQCSNQCTPDSLTTCGAGGTGGANGYGCVDACNALNQKQCDVGLASAYCANIDTDNNNCGDCHVVCAPGSLTTCGVGGPNGHECVDSCIAADAGVTEQYQCFPSGGTAYCASVETDNGNCGACFHQCGPLEQCANGLCGTSCTGGTSPCFPDAGTPYCANLVSDNDNCGTCGNQCTGGNSCSPTGGTPPGACGPACISPEVLCPAASGVVGDPNPTTPYCANTQTDSNNCGTGAAGCDNICPGGTTCDQGTCVSPLVLLFSACGAVGASGPTQSQCDAAYGGTSLSGQVTLSAGIQEWTVPTTGNYRIEAIGGQGASGNTTEFGGYGADIAGTFALTSGTVVDILVGQAGVGQGSNENGGGGGGTFVVTSGGILVVAGGGGGTRYCADTAGINGNNTPSDGFGGGTNTLCSGGPGTLCGGGTGGGGGGACSFSWGSGGAGYSGNGTLDPYDGTCVTAALSYTNGGTGGTGTCYGNAATGGFGGGGDGSGGYGGGGGGGYSGGGGGLWAGGGGSLNNGTNQSNAISSRSGASATTGPAADGLVIITFL